MKSFLFGLIKYGKQTEAMINDGLLLFSLALSIPALSASIIFSKVIPEEKLRCGVYAGLFIISIIFFCFAFNSKKMRRLRIEADLEAKKELGV